MPYSSTEKEKAYKHEWHIRNKERLDAKAAAYYRTHKEQHAINTARWKHENKEYFNELTRLRYAERTLVDDEFKERRRKIANTHYIKNRENALRWRKQKEVLNMSLGIQHVMP